MNKIIDYPKTHCPFVREKDERGHYLVKPQIAEGYDWIFDDGVRAVDKLDGTNVGVFFENGTPVLVSNRKNLLFERLILDETLNKKKVMFLEGYLNAVEKGWLKNLPKNGYVYGELVGPKINGNWHGLSKYYWVPFQVAKSKLHWKSWLENRYPKNFYELREWFKDLPSLFTMKYAQEKDKQKCTLAEGLVFWHPNGRVAKLRRDMFDWFYE